MTEPEATERLKAMIEPGQQTWDLSPNDVEAIGLALKMLAEFEAAQRKTYKEMFGP